MEMSRRAIERSFPFEELNRVAALESWRKEIHRPLSHVHKWWATRLGSVFRAILLGSIIDEDEDTWKRFYQQNDFRKTVVLDPFMGSGTTVVEALKLGCRVIGSDINPVSYFLVREALRPIEPERLTAAFERLEKRVRPCLQPLYTSLYDGQKADLLYAFWVKLITCPDCGNQTRLFPNWIFAANAYPSRKPASRCLCPSCGELLFVSHGDTKAKCCFCAHSFNPQVGPARRTSFYCEHCNHEHPIAATYRLIPDPPEHQMYALMLLLPDGRKVYKRPSEEDHQVYTEACRKLRAARIRYPKDKIPPGVNTNQARGYNYLHWHQMFNGRQLFGLGTILRQILKEPNEDVRRQFVLLFSGTLEFNNMFCSFKGEGTGAVRHLFSHHILKPERTPLENNPWGTDKSSGSFSTLFHRRLLSARAYAAHPFEIKASRRNGRDVGDKVFGISRSIQPEVANSAKELLSDRAHAYIHCGDSSKLPIPNGSIDLVVTDPPYFDNVHYSELADFFYSWLRLALEKTDKAFSKASTRSDDEVQGTCPDEFARMLGGVFTEGVRALKPNGLLVFTFHHSRDDAWIAVRSAIQAAGLEVITTHPIKAEMSVATPKNQAKEPIDLDNVIVCRRAGEISNGAPPTVQDALKRALSIIQRFNQDSTMLSKGDIRVILMGEFLRVSTFPGNDGNLSEFTGSIDTLHANQGVAPKRHEQQLLFAD